MASNEKFKQQPTQTDAKGISTTYNKKYGQVKAKMPTEKTSMYYNMKHKERGLAFIFNHQTFDIKSLKPRNGTNVDRDNLIEVLKHLGFTVRSFNDLTHQGIWDQITAAAKSDHTDRDCIIICVLSHGDEGKVYAKDRSYQPEALWHSFTSDKCPTLAGKPKLFFIQACQGSKSEKGVTLTEVDGMYDEEIEGDYTIPIHADFLICRSTIPGYVSYRNKDEGSWFIQILTQELRKYGTTRDIMTLLTIMTQRVAIEKISYNPDEPDLHEKKQVPCTTTMLTRLLKFEEKKAPTVFKTTTTQPRFVTSFSTQPRFVTSSIPKTQPGFITSSIPKTQPGSITSSIPKTPPKLVTSTTPKIPPRLVTCVMKDAGTVQSLQK